MNIILIGPLHPELTILGLKPGDVINAELISDQTKTAHFIMKHLAVDQHCIVWPENYKVTDKPITKTTKQRDELL